MSCRPWSPSAFSLPSFLLKVPFSSPFLLPPLPPPPPPTQSEPAHDASWTSSSLPSVCLHCCSESVWCVARMRRRRRRTTTSFAFHLPDRVNCVAECWVTRKQNYLANLMPCVQGICSYCSIFFRINECLLLLL